MAFFGRFAGFVLLSLNGLVSGVGMENGLTLGREKEGGSRELEPELVDVGRIPPKTISNLQLHAIPN